MIKESIFNVAGVEIYCLPHFLTESECNYLSNYIEENNHPSTVAGKGEEVHTYSETRTSHSTHFPVEDPIIRQVEEKMSVQVGESLSKAEPLHGVLYHEGQEFRDHTDYFEDQAYFNHCLASGQRTWTVMIYLNDVEVGGHTEFPEIGKSFAPQKGTAIMWKNSDGRGTENRGTLHCGLPVQKGKKIIVTKWFREFEYKPAEDIRLAQVHHQEQQNEAGENVQSGELFILDKNNNKVRIEYENGMPHARFANKELIPAITTEGFEKMPIPKSLYHRILSFYYQGLEAAVPEFDPKSNDPIKNYISSEKVYFPTEMVQLTEEMKGIIFDGLEPILMEWSGRKLGPTYCYGIRTYRRGSILNKHTDGFETRIVSAILNIDQKVEEPWALQIDDHQGEEHEVYLEPGEMVLYESAILAHGRVKALQGEFFTNLFVHYVNLT